MKLLSLIIGTADIIFRKFFDEKDLKKREQLFLRDFPQASLDVIYEAYDSIDTKATAVLQHVSIMIAAAAILYAEAKSYVRVFFGLEVICYVILAMFCLRLFMEDDFFDANQHRKNVVAKEALLDLTTKSVFAVTILFVITLVAEEVCR